MTPKKDAPPEGRGSLRESFVEVILPRRREPNNRPASANIFVRSVMAEAIRLLADREALPPLARLARSLGSEGDHE